MKKFRNNLQGVFIKQIEKEQKKRKFKDQIIRFCLDNKLKQVKKSLEKHLQKWKKTEKIIDRLLNNYEQL